MASLTAMAVSAGMRSPMMEESVSRSISMPDLMMNSAMTAPSQLSRLLPVVMKMSAATSVEPEMMESNSASLPEATSASESTFSPVFFTYSPSRIFTTTATAMMSRDSLE